jgi:hypothetical protein
MPYSGSWPLSGTMLDGVVCEHQRWAHPTGESDGSASAGWPTPIATDTKEPTGSLSRITRTGERLCANDKRRPGPTPTAQAAKHGAATDWEMSSGRNGLWIEAAHWPTPTVGMISGGQTVPPGTTRQGMTPAGTKVTIGLGTAVRWPTPAAHPFDQSPEVFDQRREILRAKGINGNGAGLILAVEVRRGQPSEATEPHQPGRLNPDWVEALMGFPGGWTLTDGPPLRDLSTPESLPGPDPASQTTESGCTPLETPSSRSAAR